MIFVHEMRKNCGYFAVAIVVFLEIIYYTWEWNLIFGDLNTEDYLICKDNSNDTIIAYSQKNGDEYNN